MARDQKLSDMVKTMNHNEVSAANIDENIAKLEQDVYLKKNEIKLHTLDDMRNEENQKFDKWMKSLKSKSVVRNPSALLDI
jgi:hypothetical protein